MKLTVNGIEREIASAPLTSLLDVLREELGVTSPKAGCEQGGCGACTVLVDGEPRRACLTPAAAADGSEIVTVEGLGSPERLAPVQQAFVHHYGMQCGFCTPGMLVAAHAYLENGGTDDPKLIAEALAGHFCRCTGYVKIVNAVAAAARGEEFDLTMTVGTPTTSFAPGGAG
jgi:aerobic-type carbon monoxide dehydrogenase small subunit (CoxS/CutS family)